MSKPAPKTKEAKKPANRPKQATSTTWKPGQSGNPKGRPKTTAAVREAIALAREKAPAVIQVLIDIATDVGADDKARIAAIKELLDRGLGKSIQFVDNTHRSEELTPERVAKAIGVLGLDIKGKKAPQ